MDESWLRFAASLGIGLLIGLERERNPAAKAGVRTFALVALAGTLAASVAVDWTIPAGLAAVAAMLIAAYLREPPQEDPGTTTVAAAVVCYLLGALAGLGEAALAGGLGIAVTALLYFKPEIEGLSVQRNRPAALETQGEEFRLVRSLARVDGPLEGIVGRRDPGILERTAFDAAAP